ncbi:glycosyltransferase family 4 protein [Streptomyces kaniharaensis]|uniref:D-inositol 3-phosphate glycosyltransferase n=1 Tax=Streptomyces kaniharaensis TaxID=212423 RepID=A0A6N7KY26_9ACTN|nr:glycosyltransferase family 4 protein [Streptomyces kaniharaensis]MQS16440.1 glycosyltransferase family 4 protein [Streptomyces kaniharaensis]
MSHPAQLSGAGNVRPLRILILGTAWSGNGGHTVNRELAGGAAELGHHVALRVIGTAGAPPHPGVTVQALDPIPGISDRGQLLRTDGLPRNVDVIVGAGRFSSGAAGYLRDQFYPAAKVVHFVHAAVDELDRWRGDPEQANQHARTERDLIARADLVVGVGPLLTDEAIRLARMLPSPPPVHQLIAGTVLKEPPTYYTGQRRLNVLLFGRADDPLKGADTAAHAVGELRNRGLDVQLVVRGGNPATLREQEAALSNMAGMPVKVRAFTGDQAEIDSDLRSADLVVIPSRQDGFPLTAMEATGFGIPILAGSNIGTGMFLSDPARVPPELGSQFVVPMRGNEPAAELGKLWADRAEPMLRNVAATRQSAMALREYFGQNYTWSHATQGLLDALQAVPPRAADGREQAVERAAQTGRTGAAIDAARIAGAGMPHLRRVAVGKGEPSSETLPSVTQQRGSSPEL